MRVNILGVEIDKVTKQQALEQIEKWVKTGGKHYVVTPNIEFVMAARVDPEFRKILNKADLAIPDSARIGWANQMLQAKGLKKLLLWPFFLFPQLLGSNRFPVTTGTDLMNELVKQSAEKGFTIGFLGGQNNIALKLLERLKKRHPRLKVGLATSDVWVDKSGEVIKGEEKIKNLELPLDILFVAFGQIKQENWMVKNLHQMPVKVMIGVGGAFDYLSGQIPRAPKWVINLGFEWLYRVMVQPWRIRRFWQLVRFVFFMLH